MSIMRKSFSIAQHSVDDPKKSKIFKTACLLAFEYNESNLNNLFYPFIGYFNNDLLFH